MATNTEVARTWMRGGAASAGNYMTVDGKLYSYALMIGPEPGVVYDYTSSGEFVSMTTSKHVGLAVRHGARIVDPPEDE